MCKRYCPIELFQETRMPLNTDRQELMDQAQTLWKEGRLEDAREVLSSAIAGDSEVSLHWELLGLVAFEMDDQALAESALERASLLGPLSAAAQIALGKCYDGSGHRAAAAAIYRHVAQLSALDAELLEPLASGLGRAGELELALDVCRRAARRMPDNPDPLVGIVHYMRRLRRPIELIVPAMFRAHHLEPENSEYRISLAWMLHELGRSDEGAHLLAAVPYEEFSCIRCLTLMKQIFEQVGEEERAAVCRMRLDVIAQDCPERRDRSREN
jgi:tetratricopeptide (TPR) repeat protein